MSLSVYSTGLKSKPKRKVAAEPTSLTPAIGRRVKLLKVAKSTKSSKPLAAASPKQTTRARKASVLAKANKPLTTSKKKAGVVKPKSTAMRKAIPPATKANHRVMSKTKKSVTFSLDAPTGSYVAVAGTFSNWEPQTMAKGQDGIWHITLQLARGMHQYRFQIDALWQEDPQNPRNTPNEHGGFDSLCEVL